MRATNACIRKFTSELQELVELAGLDETYWQRFTDRFAELLPGTAPLLFINDKLVKRCDVAISSGIEEQHIRMHTEHYASINPWNAVNFGMPLFEPTRSEVALPSSSFRETEFYQDYLRHLPHADAATGMKFWKGEERDIELTVHYDACFDEHVNRIIEPAMHALAIPMRNAFDMLRIEITAGHTENRRAVLAHIADPAFLISAGRRIIDANALAQALVENGRNLWIGAYNRLEFHDEAAGRRFDKLLAKTLDRFQPSTLIDPIFVGAGEVEYGLNMHRLSRNAVGLLGNLSAAPPCALLVVSRRETRRGAAHQVIRDHFHLTNAEARLAVCLANGASLKDASQMTSVTYQTARTQLRSIFSKLHIHRQAELVALLLPFVDRPS